MTGIAIRGTGRYLPERVVANEEFASFLDTSDEWIVSHTGISRRRVVKDEPIWHMGLAAAEQALNEADIAAKDIDMIIGTTVTSDYNYPSMACLVQNKLGNSRAFCFDIAVACAGFIYALDMARRYLATGDVKNVLIVSAEVLSQMSNYEDRGTCILFGDGAAACVVTAGDGMFGSFLKSDPTGVHHIYAKHRRRKIPFFDEAAGSTMDMFQPQIYDVTHMNGHDVYRWATKSMPEAIVEACSKVGMKPEELDFIIPHQANLRIIKTAMRNLRIPMEKAYLNIQEYGNTSSASVPICLDECIRDGKLKRGDKFCIVGFGSGLAYGACVLEY